MRLTDISVRQLPIPAKGQRIYFDETLPNFGCRVSQGATKSFVVQHGPDRQYITIGRYPVISLADARGEARRILAERTLGKFRPRSVPWSDAQRLFLSECEKKNKPRTVKDYTRLLNKHFSFGRRQLADITPYDIVRRLERVSDAPSEKRHALVALKVFFNWALGRHYVEKNPCEQMTASPQKSRDRVLSDDELAAVYKSVISGDDAFSTIVALIVLTGQRRGEVGALRWDWINTRDRTIALPAGITKNNRTHVFPCGEVVARILANVPKSGDHLFPASRSHVRGKATTTFNGWPKCKAALDLKCGVRDWTLHDLRRTVATNLAALGTPIHVTERLLNHVSGTRGGIVSVYQRHEYMDEMREAVHAWEVRLRAMLTSCNPGKSVDWPRTATCPSTHTYVQEVSET